RELLQFVKDNDDEAKKIAERGEQFIAEHLRMEDVARYWRSLLTRYSQLLTYKVRRRKDYREVTRNPDHQEL
ncbi:hypothetical protein AB205_0016900, partial [Aquarana catesbeiana]